MRRFRGALLVLAVAASPLWAAPPDVPKRVEAKVGELVTFEVKGKDVGYQPAFDPAKCLLVRLHSDDPAVMTFLVQPKVAGDYGVAFWTKGETRGTTLVVSTTGPAPDPQPDPGPGPGPQPDPMPGPVTSFRVIFVYESADTLTPAQNSVIYGKAVSDYLNARATKEGNVPGWRRFDRDIEGVNETPTMKALWAAVRPKVTATPCVAIEVNGKVTIEPLPATPAEAVELFNKYTGGK